MTMLSRSATAQLNIRIAPDEKQRVKEDADRADLTVSDYVRIRLFSADVPEDEEQAIIALLDQLRPALDRAVRHIDGNLHSMRQLASLAPVDEHAIAARVRRELAPAELDAIATRLQLASTETAQ